MNKLITVAALLILSKSIFAQHDYDEAGSSGKQNKFLRQEFGFGLEEYSKSNNINGGNYLFVQYHYQLFERLSIGGKFSSDLAPNTFDDMMTHAGLRYNSLLEPKKFGKTVGLYYVHNYKGTRDKDFLSLELALLAFTSNYTYEIDFMPIAVLYAMDSGRISVGYKFIALKINF